MHDRWRVDSLDLSPKGCSVEPAVCQAVFDMVHGRMRRGE